MTTHKTKYKNVSSISSDAIPQRGYEPHYIPTLTEMFKDDKVLVTIY